MSDNIHNRLLLIEARLNRLEMLFIKGPEHISIGAALDRIERQIDRLERRITGPLDYPGDEEDIDDLDFDIDDLDFSNVDFSKLRDLGIRPLNYSGEVEDPGELADDDDKPTPA